MAIVVEELQTQLGPKSKVKYFKHQVVSKSLHTCVYLLSLCVCVCVCAMISKTPKGSPSQVASRAWCCSVSFASINRAQQTHIHGQRHTRVSAHWAWLCRGQICIVAAVPATVLTGPTSGDPKKYLVTSRCAACKFQLKNFPFRAPNPSYKLQTKLELELEL